MTASATQAKETAVETEPRQIKSRTDLSFVRTGEIGIDSNWDVPHDYNAQWSDGLTIGQGFFAEVAELAHHDEYQAFLAAHVAMNTPDWQPNGWGIEGGFSKELAAAAIIGLRAIRAGAVPYDYKGESLRRMELDK